MKRILIIASAVFLFNAHLQSQPISEREAMDRALNYLNGGNTGMRVSSRGGGLKLESVPVESDGIYAFNIAGGGYIIASADSRTLPVLGYSNTGSISWEQMPPNMRSWLKSYEDAMATLGEDDRFRDGNIKGDASRNRVSTRNGRGAVEPLIKTHWNQLSPYWDMTPIYEGAVPEWQGQQCKVGCMAVALAQVMNYYKWPKSVPNGLPGYDIRTEYGSDVKMWHIDSLEAVSFDWDNMLDTYNVVNPETGAHEQIGTEVERHAIATLLRYCGQAMKAQYGVDEGTENDAGDDQKALTRYFGYPAATFLEDRSRYSIDGWEEIIYGEVAAGRPVLYFGTFDRNNGHAFLCDGYDGNGLFHMNWGWDGDYDGYYSLSVLNPYEETEALIIPGYCIFQGAVIYIDPELEIQSVPEEYSDDSESGNLILLDGAITKGKGRLGENNVITVQVRNTSQRDYAGYLCLVPQYYGDMEESSITEETEYLKGDTIFAGGYIRAGEQSGINFNFSPQRLGTVRLKLYDSKNYNIGSFSLKLTNDTLAVFDRYVENCSYLVKEEDNWYYQVELRDKVDDSIPHFVLADSLRFKVGCNVDDNQILAHMITDEIRDYLRQLPEKGGHGDYVFSRKVPVDNTFNGYYEVFSYIGEWICDSLVDITMSCYQIESFQYDDPTSVGFIEKNPITDTIFDLWGRPFIGAATKKGIYIRDGKLYFTE